MLCSMHDEFTIDTALKVLILPRSETKAFYHTTHDYLQNIQGFWFHSHLGDDESLHLKCNWSKIFFNNSRIPTKLQSHRPWSVIKSTQHFCQHPRYVLQEQNLQLNLRQAHEAPESEYSCYLIHFDVGKIAKVITSHDYTMWGEHPRNQFQCIMTLTSHPNKWWAKRRTEFVTRIPQEWTFGAFEHFQTFSQGKCAFAMCPKL